ncbi:hypothetical protein [Pseudomonas sp. MRSN 12121]|uniref:hypothetical protein n=1 Tax=Pseudomonas sp. MRSN 12121 TaxID=1611770 RepID=UPI0012E03378|nr:hypothetical protein [Pseudomonas sp. MRSN 12121]
MAAKPTKGTPSTADAAQGDVSQTAAAAPAAAALPPTPPAASGEQPGDQTATPATPAPGAPAADGPNASDELSLDGRLDEFRAPIRLSGSSSGDAADLKNDATDEPELLGYLVTDVSSVLHDGTWYHLGDEIFLNDEEADPLLDRRIIEPSGSKK